MISADFVASYFEAWNHRDAGAVASHLASDGTYCDMPLQRTLAGPELIAYLQDYFARDCNRYRLVGEILSGESTIAFQYQAVPEDGGADAAWTGAEFVTLEGDAAVQIEDYYRSPDLELAPGSGGPQWQRRVQRYAKSGLDEDALQQVMRRLETHMERERCYLRADLTLPQLAGEMDCSINHLSQVINAGCGMSFYDYVNGYRVRRATELLAAPDARPILDIALAVGFNSSSTFYSAFRKVTGKTPAQFRKTAELLD